MITVEEIIAVYGFPSILAPDSSSRKKGIRGIIVCLDLTLPEHITEKVIY